MDRQGDLHQGTRDNYKITNMLGEGGMGSVYEAKTSSGHTVVLKFPADHDPENRAIFTKKLKLEAKFLRKLADEQRIVKYIDEAADQSDFFLAIKKISGATIDKCIPPAGFSEIELVYLSLDIAEGLKSMHKHGIFHRDLKPQNIMYADDGRCTIIDLGIAKEYVPDSRRGTQILACNWLCPEVCAGRGTPKCDLYSLGWIMFYMATTYEPPANRTDDDTMKRELSSFRQHISAELSGLVTELIDPTHAKIQQIEQLEYRLKRLPMLARFRTKDVTHDTARRPTPPGPYIKFADGIQQMPTPIPDKPAGLLIGRRHDLEDCVQSGGGCNQPSVGDNLYLGWYCPPNCQCPNPAHNIDKHHMRVFKDSKGRVCAINVSPNRLSAVKRRDGWEPLEYNQQAILKDGDQVSLYYKPAQPRTVFTLHARK